jgi:hypothetical protein
LQFAFAEVPTAVQVGICELSDPTVQILKFDPTAQGLRTVNPEVQAPSAVAKSPKLREIGFWYFLVMLPPLAVCYLFGHIPMLF